MDNKTSKPRNFLIISGCIFVVVLAIVGFFKYLFDPLLPVILALILAFPSIAFSKKLYEKTKFSRKFWAISILMISVLVLGVLIYSIVRGIIDEIYDFSSNINAYADSVSGMFDRVAEFIREHLPSLAEKINSDAIRDKVLDFVYSLAGPAAGSIAKWAMSIPEILLFVVVTFFSAYYFAVDGSRIKAGIYKLFPEEKHKTVEMYEKRLIESLKGYFRAGGIMMVVTFVELAVGFFIIDINFALVLAMIVAVIDFLPVLGTGTVLIPWSILSLISGDVSRGVGLIILYFVTVVVRQLIEPRIMGKKLGIHPLVSIISTYMGLCLFGIPGMIFLPIAASVITGMLSPSEGENTP